jgi:Pyridoxamine 5'-phosphate oxidase
MSSPARSAQQRKQDTLDRLERDEDAWVASAGPGADVYLVPLSFLWDGELITVATPESSPTGRNLAATGKVRLCLGETRDVVLIEGTVEAFTLETVPVQLADAFAAKCWDARDSKPRYGFFRITPQLIQAWRQVNELSGRDLMRDGNWLL